ncbi:MAG: TRAP transporter large permease subunit [Sneathiellaceae bacterium]
MDTITVAIVSLAALLVLLALKVPIGVALGLISFAGFWILLNFDVALSTIRTIPYEFSANWDLTAIPMFLLMGAIVNQSGISTALFRAARLWLGGLPGGLAVATNMACAGFGAASGSSVAASAAMARLAVPEMLRHGYDKGLAAGVVACGGTLAALIPPSILFVLYGIFAQVSIVDLLIAGVLPGILTATVYTAMILIRCRINPALAPETGKVEFRANRAERWIALAEVWPLLLLILAVIGGLYGGVVSPTEAGAGGAFVALLIAVLQGRMKLPDFLASMKEAMSATAQIFFVGMGAVMYTRFLAFSGAGNFLTETIGSWAFDPILLVLALSIVYLILGMFLDPLGIMLITIPVFLPMFQALNLDLVWLGVIMVKYIEIGLLTPPVGFNVYVVKGVVGDRIPLETIFRGCFWFLACEVVIMALLIGFPEISLFLPETMR